MRDLREPADDLAPTVRDLGALSPDLEKLFNDVGPLVDASSTGVPAASRFLRGAEPVLASTHTFLRQLNPILAYLSFSRNQLSEFLTAGGPTLAGTGVGGYKANGAGEHYLNQLAIIDERSLLQRAARPPWDRGNAYVAPNAYPRAIPLGVIESFDCNPAAASSATHPAREAPPRRPASWRRGRSSRTRSSRACGRAGARRRRSARHPGRLAGAALEGPLDALDGLPVQLDVRRPRRVRIPLTSGAARRRSTSTGVAMCALVGRAVGEPATGRRSKIAPPPLFTHDDRQSAPARRAASSPPRSCSSASSPISSDAA